MNLQRKMSTDYRLWFIFAVVAFISLGFFQLHIANVENKTGSTSFWSIVFWAPQNLEIAHALTQMAAYGALIFVPAVAFGWITQAIVVSVRSAMFPEKQNPISN